MRPQSVSIREVGPRDGLQAEDPVSTDAKVQLIEKLSDTGLSRIEAVSFVHPKAIPQMADADDVWKSVTPREGIRYSALAPNARGVSRALDHGFREIEVVVSVSEKHNKANLNRTVDESLAEFPPLLKQAHDAGASVEAIIATSFGCPYAGDTDPADVARIIQRLVDQGVDRVAFGDTTGMSTPYRVAALLDAVKPISGDLPLLLHFHNTRGTALANILTALDYGVTEFDAAVGGLGGCPYAPGASGNVATEEVVHMLHDMGIDTGVDLDKLLEVAEYAQSIIGHELPSGVLKAGPRTRLTEMS